MIPTPTELRSIIFARRMPMVTESELQEAIAERLASASIAFDRELRLEGDAGRIDFAVMTTDGRLGIECKTKGGGMAWVRQLGRYGRTLLFTRLVLITTRPTTLPLSYIETSGANVPIDLWPVPAL